MKSIRIIMLICCFILIQSSRSNAQAPIKWSAPMGAYPKAWAQTSPPQDVAWGGGNQYAAYTYGYHPGYYYANYGGRPPQARPQQAPSYGGGDGYAAPATYGYQQMYGAF